MLLDGDSQRDIAKQLGVTQPAISCQVARERTDGARPSDLVTAGRAVLRQVAKRRGFTKLADLAQEMGIASASIYACFGSKEDLFRQVMALYTATAGAPPRQALTDTPTTRMAIERMLSATVDQITSADSPHYCMLVLAAPTGAIENDAVLEFLAEGRRGQRAAIRARLERGVAEGDLAASADCDALARYYATVVQGLSIQARDGATRSELDDVVACAIAAWDALAR
ncbi:TetR/AcrR family transcriptional regulator [Rathayibacter soli]|uniref:TetR/AcrR family transcriptional regulator n=1 Tax=Rathayibacter soli TaxID=3144168 RepID=UPI0027E4BD30|nr:TetR/AcrR family transcriptional regulator [Glaciibacter superstes]